MGWRYKLGVVVEYCHLFLFLNKYTLMKKSIITYTLIISTLLLLNCNTKKHVGNCSELYTGTFEIYEHHIKIGKIFRYKDYQFEKYLNSNKITIIKTKKEGCTFFFNAIEIIEPLDTITFKMEYKLKEKGYYSMIAKAAYLDINYEYHGELKKISNSITDRDILKKIDSLKNR